MSTLKNILLILTMGLVGFGCQSGGCRPSAQIKNSEIPTSKPTTSAERVLVYKYDGSAQCGQGKAIPMDNMKKELAPMTIYNSFKKNDGQMRIQVCGAASGEANVFEIDRTSLEAALKKGFKEWVFE
ncbi:MAG: hypothetical protein V4736_06185 [Bdellovibrionota bacterium]